MFNKVKSKSHNRLLMEKDYTTLCYTLCARTLSSQSPESILKKLKSFYPIKQIYILPICENCNNKKKNLEAFKVPEPDLLPIEQNMD